MIWLKATLQFKHRWVMGGGVGGRTAFQVSYRILKYLKRHLQCHIEITGYQQLPEDSLTDNLMHILSE